MKPASKYIKVKSKWVSTPFIEIIKTKSVSLGPKKKRANFNSLQPDTLDKILKAIRFEVGFTDCELIIDHD
ncbi:MAG: hypothetical protein RBQ91_00430 [Acholeplasma sp.]|nr:hypothetical protein [Acholeplasma sp.]